MIHQEIKEVKMTTKNNTKMSKNKSLIAASQKTGKKDQKEQICIVEKIQEFLEMVRSQEQALARMYEACPWLIKAVGAERQKPQVKN